MTTSFDSRCHICGECFPTSVLNAYARAHVWQARYAQPLVVRNYGQLVPSHQTPIGGVFIASMAQVYPEDRGTNYAVRDGRAVAALADAFLVPIRTDKSLSLRPTPLAHRGTLAG